MQSIKPDRAKILLRRMGSIVTDFVRSSESAGTDFGVVEAATGIAVDRVRRLLVSAGLTAAVEEAGPFHCPDCSRVLSAWSRGLRSISTAEGDGLYPAVRYRCNSCATDHYPVEAANGLEGDQFTTGAKAVIAESAADLAYAHVSATLARSRAIGVSAKEVDRTVREVAGWRAKEEKELARSAYGEEAAFLRAANIDPLTDAPVLHGFASWPAGAPALISVDGAMVRSTSKGPGGLEWFECRAGVIRSAGEEKRSATFYTGGVCTPDALFDQLGACFQKAVPCGCTAVFVADGARWIWDRVALYFPRAIQVLDFYHACEHIDSAAAAWRGAGTLEAITWRTDARKRLQEKRGVSRVIRDLLEALRKPENVADPRALRTELRYLLGHRHRMRYQQFMSLNLPIGSGAMESAIKQMTTARLRMPGMKWTREGADAILRLRGAKMSNTLCLTTGRRHDTLQKAAKECYQRQTAKAA